MPNTSPRPAPVGTEEFLSSVRRIAESEGRELEDLLGEVLADLQHKRAEMRPQLRQWYDEHSRRFGNVHKALAAHDASSNER